jgi:hypothetical protein
MASDRRDRVVRALLDGYGTTYAEEAGISMRDAPSPLYRLLVLSVLLSARIPASTAVAAARELSAAGLRTPARMLDASWADRVAALDRGGYRRFDERAASMLGEGAELVLDEWSGDLRRLHSLTAGDTVALRNQLQRVPGIGPVGSAIFCREVQGAWSDVAPFADERVQAGARTLGLPTSPVGLAALVQPADLPRLAAACVRASLDDGVVTATREAARP